MGRILVVAVCSFLLVAGSATAVTTGKWTPGTNYLVSEEDANNFLEGIYDFAYCDGIARYGHRGEFPYEEFVMFECGLKDDGTYCGESRWKAVKGKKRGYYRMRLVKMGRCF